VTDGPDARDTTEALRLGSIGRLQDGFRRHVRESSARASWDSRDEMLSLAVFTDCARRLGHDPAVALGPIAAEGADVLRETFDEFVRRPGVTLAAFGWSVVDTPDGPAYTFAWPSWRRERPR
jgi:hypothetical protein